MNLIQSYFEEREEILSKMKNIKSNKDALYWSSEMEKLNKKYNSLGIEKEFQEVIKFINGK